MALEPGMNFDPVFSSNQEMCVYATSSYDNYGKSRPRPLNEVAQRRKTL